MSLASRFARGLLFRSRRTWRYALVAALAFVLGSATLVAAAAPSGISIGSMFFMSMLNGVPTTPCTTITAPDGAKTTTCVAVINSNGELSTNDAAARAALAQFQFGSDGSLKTSSQGTSTISGNVNVNNFPATQQVGGTVSVANLPGTQQVAGSVSVSNLPSTQQVAGSVSVSNLPATQQVAGSVNVGNFPSDQQIHGSVTVTNLPAATGGSGVSTIDLATHAVPSGQFTAWDVDVSGCRSFSAFIWSSKFAAPSISMAVRTPTGDFFDVELRARNGFAASQWAFPVQPGTFEPFYTALVNVEAKNNANDSSDLTGKVYCQH